VAVPQEKVWRGGGWSKRQKLSFVRKAFDQLIQRLKALQAEWDEFEKTIDDEELGMIVRTLAHEIAGTLTLLLGCDGLEPRGEKVLARTVHLVRQLQEAPSLRTGFFTVQPKEVSVKRMVNDVVQSVQRVWRDKEFLVNWDVDETLKVVGDRNLYSVLQNLVYNALSFSEKEILIEVGPGLRDDNVLIKVTDDGPGVPTKKREWIFKPLVSEGTDYRPRGKGVGLHIARRMARAVEGDVYLEKPQDGEERSNQFVIKLPVAHSK
jgi:signal transduction histidine kinase